MQRLPISAEALCQALQKDGFHVETMSDNGEALYCKPYSGRVSTYVTVPMGCDPIPESVAKQIFQTAGIPYPFNSSK